VNEFSEWVNAMETEPDIDQLHQQYMEDLCRRNGYLDYRKYPNSMDACIAPFIFTHAIIADLDTCGYGDRWCYHSYAAAKAALDAWDGEGEPQGWHRHPDTGRRRPGGDATQEYVER
jgi:hypothetical protein